MQLPSSVNSKEARHRLPVLVIAAGTVGSQVRQMLLNIGFTTIASAPTFSQALRDAKDGQPSLVLFDMERVEPGISAVNLVEYLKKITKDPLLIAIAMKPHGETIFELLKNGTHGFIIPPFSTGAMEQVFLQIQDGVDLSPEILGSDDKSATFARLVREHINKVHDRAEKCRAQLSSQEFVAELTSGLKSFVRMAHFFCDSKEDPFSERICHELVEYAMMLDNAFEKSRLRRIREQLREQRGR